MGFAALLATADRAARVLLGSAVTYTPGAGSPVAVKGVFDARYIEAAQGSQVGISTSGPAVFLTLSDLPSDPETDLSATVTVGGVTYKPHEVQKDGQGAVLLLLNKA